MNTRRSSLPDLYSNSNSYGAVAQPTDQNNKHSVISISSASNSLLPNSETRPSESVDDIEHLEALRVQVTQVDSFIQAARLSGDEQTAVAFEAHLKDLQVELRNRERLKYQYHVDADVEACAAHKIGQKS